MHYDAFDKLSNLQNEEGNDNNSRGDKKYQCHQEEECKNKNEA